MNTHSSENRVGYRETTMRDGGGFIARCHDMHASPDRLLKKSPFGAV
ncbi:MAG: hypothetical protein Q7J57_09150 [Gemmobacter sp.]|nr:hypothetical protein [Gemmobacter sp.]